MFGFRTTKRRLTLLAFAAICMLAVPMLHAQVTNGTIAGTVTAKQDGSALPGVTVEAIHAPTGTRYSTVSGSNGYYQIPNVRIGGPYRVTASLEGFQPSTAEHIDVRLGETTSVPLALGLAGVSEAITVTASTDPVINPNHTGSTTSVSTQQLETLPTVNRQLQDFARTNPYFTTSLTGDGTFMFVAGRNNRYNNIQIDGAVNNDLFGLAAAGTPGASSDVQPVSLDAIQQIQLLVSPYDVRQSGFTGGAVNAVTRSGTNNLEGSLFGTKRNLDYIGKNDTLPVLPNFDQTQYGGRVGGRILRDRLFYFVSGEKNNREQPNGTRACTDAADCAAALAANTPGVYRGTPTAYDLRNFLMSKYNYDPGDLSDIVFQSKSDLLFGRLDANLGSANAFTLRHNYVKGSNFNAPSSFTRSTSRFYYPNNLYLFPSKTNSTVAQLNSVFSASAFNEARVNLTKIRDFRQTPGQLFPTIEIGTAQRSGPIQAGVERFSGANSLNQDILELTDDVTLTRGNHNFVVGTSNQLFKFSNLFIQDFYGYYLFPDFAALQAGTPSQYSIGFATGANPRRPTAFKAGQYGLYASDQWHVGKGVTLTMGLRADKPKFNTTPSFNQNVQTALGFNTTDVPDEKISWEPRFGFNWDIGSTAKQQLRGGIGVFQGRAPFVWISNAYGGTGVEQVLLTCASNTNPALNCVRPAFNPDPASQPRNLGSASAQDISLTDPSFQFPRVLRGTLGYDRELPLGIRGSVELLLSHTQQDVFYNNVAKAESGVSPLDGRKTYATRAGGFGNAYFLTNTDEGREFTQTITLDKTFHNLTLNANYAHQSAKSVGDFTSSTARSQWEFGYISRTGDLVNPELTRSVFEIQHRYNLSATYNLRTGPFTHGFGLFYVAQSGQPYSLLLGGTVSGADVNRDGSANNDLLYIPKSLIVCPTSSTGAPSAAGACRTAAGAVQTPLSTDLWNTFLNSVGLTPGSGSAPERNAFRAPWTRRLDFHYEIGLPQVMGTQVQLQADILNLMNMISRDNGIQNFVTNNTYMPVTYSGQDPATGLPVYREAGAGRLTPGTQFSTANLASRWQGRLGVRVSF
jgi:hypothetical protein